MDRTMVGGCRSRRGPSCIQIVSFVLLGLIAPPQAARAAPARKALSGAVATA